MDTIDFRAIVEQLPVVVYVDALDDRSSPLYVSPQIERLLGYTSEEWLADPELFVKSLHPDDRSWVLREIEARNRGSRPASTAAYRLVARDGSVVWVRDDEVVVSGPDGRPVHVASRATSRTSPRATTTACGWSCSPVCSRWPRRRSPRTS